MTKIELTTALTKDGFAIQNYRPFRDGPCDITQYMAPSTVKIDMNVGQDGVTQTLELYASPSRPGFCIHVGRMVIVKGSDGKMPGFLKLFTLPMPKWLNHVLAASFLNQDALFLHHQERMLAKTGAHSSLLHGDDAEPQQYTKAVLPLEFDVGVLNYRNGCSYSQVAAFLTSTTHKYLMLIVRLSLTNGTATPSIVTSAK
jgi:hypothetical protein